MDTTPTSHEIAIEDINLIVNIIATVSKRGAFEAPEFQIVGSLFERLRSLLPPPVEAPAPEVENTVESSNTGQDQDQLQFDLAVDGKIEA
jgi:hypothetical protein